MGLKAYFSFVRFTMADIRLRIVGECIIEVGDRQLGPDSPHLFALLLYLAIERGRAVQRSELHELLFPDEDSPERTSHNLRQLLYRLRKFAVPVRTSGSAVSLCSGSNDNVLSSFTSLGREARSKRSLQSLEILPSYDPHISRPLNDWVDSVRASAGAQLRTLLLDDFHSTRRECRWETAVRLGRLFRQVDFANEEVVKGVAEGLLMLGRKHEALAELDSFLAEHGCSETNALAIRKFRGRIEKAKPQLGTTQATFRGREDTLLALRDMWSAANDNRPQLCVLLGAPGIGKTRLAAEFGAHLILQGAQSLTYRCEEGDTQRPLAAFTQLVPQLRALRGSLGTSPELQRYLDLLSTERSRRPSLEPASLEATRAEISLALIDLVDAVTSEQPLLLTIDDAHLLDLASWTILCSLCDRRGRSALMVLCCCRGTDATTLPLSAQTSTAVQRLSPLDNADSLALLTELRPTHPNDDQHTRWCLSQASGNPFYLHSLARQDIEHTRDDSVPFDIRNLASSLYFSLDANARALLESCLFLGRFASVRRVQETAEINGGPLLAALRRLEHSGLITFGAGELRLSHGLLEEAIRSLVPRTVAAALHARVAQCLETDYERQSYSVPLAWAAAESWLAAGDSNAAVRLLKHCAAQAAAIGEPRAAAHTLLKISPSDLSLTELASLQDEIITYAEAGGERLLLQETLRERIGVARALGTRIGEIQEFEFQYIEVDLQQGAHPAPWLDALKSLLTSESARTSLRVRAGICLLVASDLLLDEARARSTYSLLHGVLRLVPQESDLRRRAELVYETAFGSQRRALDVVQEILSEYPEPSLSQSSLRARHDVGYALSRLGHFSVAKPVLLANYRFMLAHHVLSEAFYSALLLADNALFAGDLNEAADWLANAESDTAVSELRKQQRAAGLYSTKANLALVTNALDEADALVSELCDRYPIVRTPRFGGIVAALKIRIKAARGHSLVLDPLVSELRDAYCRGGHLGGQDHIVEALWQVARSASDSSGASRLLTEYLGFRRRELTPPDSSLRTSTAADVAWNQYSTRSDLERLT
jgi:DNA-binding SARP family transcriptional activator